MTVKTKNFYSKELNRLAFIEISRGGNLYEFLTKKGFNLDELIRSDKKYIAKLSYKRKKDFFENPEKLSILSYTITDGFLKSEIELLDEAEKTTQQIHY